jgi:hypothetical protein
MDSKQQMDSKQMDRNTDFSGADNELSNFLNQPPVIIDNNDDNDGRVVQPRVRENTEIRWGPGCGSQCKNNFKPLPPPPPPPSVHGGKRKKRGMKRTSKNSKKYKNKNHKRHQTKRVIKKRNKLNNS